MRMNWSRRFCLSLPLCLLLVAGPGRFTSQAAPARIYQVRSGDYLARIARRFQIAPEAIIAANQLQDPNLLRQGKRLLLPAKAHTNKPAKGNTTAKRARVQAPTPAVTKKRSAPAGKAAAQEKAPAAKAAVPPEKPKDAVVPAAPAEKADASQAEAPKETATPATPTPASTPAPAPAKEAPSAALAPSPAPARNSSGEPLITNVFADTDLRQALSDTAAQAGVTIIPDSTVQGTISADLKDVPLEQALGIILQAGGFAFTKLDNYYLVGAPDPSNPNFYLLTKTEVVNLKYALPQTILALLGPTYGRYLSAEGVTPPQPRSSSPRGNGNDDAYRPASTGNSSNTPGQRYRVLITAPPQLIERIKSDIALLDQPQTQVMLEAVVLEVSEDALKNVGIDWATRWVSGQTSSSSEPNLVYSTVANTEMAALTALVQKGMAALRANPRIATVEGQTAELEVGKDAYFAIITGPVTYQYTTLEKIRSGIFLRITPRILLPEREVAALVEPEVADVTGKGMNGLPEITFRRAATNMRVRDGQSIIIGGMQNDYSTHTEMKIPILGDLPLVGRLFRRTSGRKSRTEVVIIITPRILDEGTETAAK